MKLEELSSYKITWIEVTPVNRKFILKKDLVKISGIYMPIGRKHERFRRPFPNKEKAKEWINNFDKKLIGKYKVRLFTDRQFKLAKAPDYNIEFTKKQIEETYNL